MASSRRLQIRLTEDQFDLISRTAGLKEMTITELVLKLTIGWCEQFENSQAPVKAPVVVHASPVAAPQRPKPVRDPYKGMTYAQIREAETNGGTYTDEDGDTAYVRYG